MSHHVTISCDLNYLNNTSSNFYSLLAEPLTLASKYEVALTEIYYPIDYNVELPVEVRAPSYFKFQNPNSQPYFDRGLNYDLKTEEDLLKKKTAHLEIGHAESYSILVTELTEYPTMRRHFKLIHDFHHYESRTNIIFEHVKQYPNLFTLFNLRSSEIANIGHLLVNITSLLKDQLTELETHFFNQAQKFVINFKGRIDLVQKSENIQYSQRITLPDRASSSILYELMFKQFSGLFFSNRDRQQFIIKPFCEIEANAFFSIIDKKITIKKKECVALAKSFSIHTDIIEENIVFNKMAPVLKIIKPEGIYTDYICKSFENPHFLRVNKTFISTILIQIKDQDNNFVQFNSGSIVIKLHFRPLKK